MEILFGAEYRSIMPFPRYSGRVGVSYQVPKAARAAKFGHDLADRYSHQN
jgi:hypothetical protein